MVDDAIEVGDTVIGRYLDENPFESVIDFEDFQYRCLSNFKPKVH